MQKLRKSVFTSIVGLLLFVLNVNCLSAEEISFSKHPNLDYIAVNNEDVQISKEGKIEVKDQDTVKISGIGTPSENISLFVLDQVYSTTVDENGNWFVLFSIQNFEEKEHTIRIKVGEKEVEDLVVFSVVKDENAKISLNDEQKVDRERIDIKYILVIVLIPLLLVGGWFLGSYSERKKISNIKND